MQTGAAPMQDKLQHPKVTWDKKKGPPQDSVKQKTGQVRYTEDGFKIYSEE